MRWSVLRSGWIWGLVLMLGAGAAWGESPSTEKKVAEKETAVTVTTNTIPKKDQKIRIRAIDLKKGLFEIQNNYDAIDLDQFEASWALNHAGEEIKRLELGRLKVAPHTKKEIRIPFHEQIKNLQKESLALGESFVIIEFKQPEKSNRASAGQCVAWEEISVNPEWRAVLGGFAVAALQQQSKDTAVFNVVPSEDQITIHSANVTAKISKKTGALVSWKVNGEEVLAKPLEPGFWKRMSQSRTNGSADNSSNVWRDAAAKRKVTSIQTKKEKQSISVTVDMRLPVGKTTCQVTYQIFDTGLAVVSEALTPEGKDLPPIPRIGMDMAIAAKYDQIDYCGLSGKTYSDRKADGRIGTYKASAKTWNGSVHPPQDAGNRSDTRWIALSDKDEESIGFIAIDNHLLNVSVWPFTLDDLEKAKKSSDLPSRDTLHIRIDYLNNDLQAIPADREYKHSFALTKAS